MLTLETAKKLKEAGWSKETEHFKYLDNYSEKIYLPSLEELLEVMPSYITHKGFEYGFSLLKTFNGYVARYEYIYYLLEKTPSEAVANLYLKLIAEGLIK